MADTSSRFGQFREVLLAMEGKADAKGLVEEITLLRAIRAKGDRILQTASHNHTLTMAVLRNRLLLPEVGIAPEIVKGDEGALRLVEPTGTGSLGGATGQPFTDGGRQARRAQRFASSGKGGQYPQESAAICPHPWPARAGVCNAVGTIFIHTGAEHAAGRGEKRAAGPATTACKRCGR